MGSDLIDLMERRKAETARKAAEALKDPRIVTFGSPEPSAVVQLANCLNASGDGRRAVLCADNHKGYSQPIGGAVGYAHSISPSGVGYDIGCFAANTRVFTLDGKHPTLAEIVDKTVYVLSSMPGGKVVPARAVGRRTRSSAPLIRVTLDNDEEMVCTPDHLFMLRDGSYKRADEMTPGQSLMPLYWTPDKDGYILVRQNNTGRLVRLHWMVFHAGLLGRCPDLEPGDELVLHHNDFVPSNNDPANLVPMGKKHHDLLHAAFRNHSHFGTEEFEADRLQGIRDFWIKARNDPAFMERRRKQAAKNSRTAVENPSFREKVSGNGKRGGIYLRQYNDSGLRRVPTFGPAVCTLCGQRFRCQQWLGRHVRRVHPEMKIRQWRPGRGIEAQMVAQNNHKVVSIEMLQSVEDVYCLEVPGHNNFALVSGVFVHNCGNKAVLTDAMADDIEFPRVMTEIKAAVSFGMGRKNEERVDDPIIDRIAASPWASMHRPSAGAQAAAKFGANVRARPTLLDLAILQLGTVGAGNHYVDLLSDQHGRLWVACHFGSRGFGHSIASGFLAIAKGKSFEEAVSEGEMDSPPTLLDDRTPSGQDYIHAMALAGAYAHAGRDWVVDRVLKILGCRPAKEVHNHHNYAWRESHFGEDLWVVRKGCTPAFPGQEGFVGGSMGDISVVLEGVDSALSAEAMYSTIHGAGRIMSRTAAAGKGRWKGGVMKRVSKGVVDWDAVNKDLKARGIVLRGGEADEAPEVYRPLQQVLDAHKGTIGILHILTPRGVAMAGRDDGPDPFKD